MRASELLGECTRRELLAAARAAHTVISVMQACAERGHSVLTAMLPATVPQVWQHYTLDESHDRQQGYHYYYHCHPRTKGREHGHFHLFAQTGTHAERRKSHLLAVAVDGRGLPLRLFTTNRWVTEEHWLRADAVLRLLRGFSLHSPARQPLHDWLAALLRLFAPQARALVQARDARLSQLSLQRPPAAVLDDRRIQIFSQTAISITGQIRALERALAF